MQVPRKAFRPVPDVDSTVVRIVPHRPPPLSEEQERRLRSLTRMAFQWRRKQMQKILREHPDAGLAREVVEALGRLGGWDMSRRPETFHPEELARLAGLLAARGWDPGAGGTERVAPEPGPP
jgi:16S rRNA (adenine1518-N6/adenine1519-N6)-dimethyltransferase